MLPKNWSLSLASIPTNHEPPVKDTKELAINLTQKRNPISCKDWLPYVRSTCAPLKNPDLLLPMRCFILKTGDT